MASVEIPHPLRDVWYLDNEALRTTLETGDLGGMDMSSLLKWYLGLFMDDEDEQQSHEVPSLKFMVGMRSIYCLHPCGLMSAISLFLTMFAVSRKDAYPAIYYR